MKNKKKLLRKFKIFWDFITRFYEFYEIFPKFYEILWDFIISWGLAGLNTLQSLVINMMEIWFKKISSAFILLNLQTFSMFLFGLASISINLKFMVNLTCNEASDHSSLINPLVDSVQKNGRYKKCSIAQLILD